MFYEMTIAGLKRQLPLCKVTDDLYIAAFIMFSDVEITKAAAGELLKKAPQFDIMITAESREYLSLTRWPDSRETTIIS